MWIDPVVKETRELGEKYTAKFDNNLDAIFSDLKAKEKNSKIVYLTPKPYLQVLKEQS